MASTHIERLAGDTAQILSETPLGRDDRGALRYLIHEAACPRKYIFLTSGEEHTCDAKCLDHLQI